MDNSIIELFVCSDCSRKRNFESNVKCVGKKGELFYAIKEPMREYDLEPVDFLSDKKLYDFLHSDDLIYHFIPKFGKFEFEEYISDELKKAIFVTNSLTDLFNTSLIYDGIKIDKDKIRERLNTILEEVSICDYVFTYKIREDKLKEAMEAYYNNK